MEAILSNLQSYVDVVFQKNFFLNMVHLKQKISYNNKVIDKKLMALDSDPDQIFLDLQNCDLFLTYNFK